MKLSAGAKRERIVRFVQTTWQEISFDTIACHKWHRVSLSRSAVADDRFYA